MNCSRPGLPLHHQLPEFTQTRVHRVSDAIHPSHPLSSPSPPAPNPSQHQGLFQRVNSLHEVAKVLEFQFHPRHLEFISKQNGEKAFLIVLDKTTTTKLRFHRVGNLRSQIESSGRATL